MAYTVNKTNGTVLATVADNTIDNTADVSLVGKNYLGYGEVIAENFVKLLENFSNSSAPTNPIAGQIWYDSLEGRLKVYNGTAFKGVSTTTSATPPLGGKIGDLWIDTANSQLYAYFSTDWVLVGPGTTGGIKNGQVVETVIANDDTTKTVVKIYNNNDLVGTISNAEFTPKSPIAGFDKIYKGFTLSTSISSAKFVGTATDSDKLGGIAASGYLTGTSNDTTTGTLSILNDGGITVGQDGDVTILVSSGSGIIRNTTENADVQISVNDGGSQTTILHVDGETSRVGIRNISPAYNLDITGTLGVSSNATVTGTTTSQNFAGSGTNAQFTNKYIKVNTGGTEADAGLIVETGDTDDARLFYDVSANSWAAGEGGTYYNIYTTNNAASTNTASKLVLRDSSGNFSAGTITASTFTGALSGSATGATHTANTKFKAANGTAAIPSYTFTSGELNGLYYAATNTVGVSINGSEVGRFTTTGYSGNTITANNTLVADGITITDNIIKTNSSNANLELSANGTGGIVVAKSGGKVGFFGTAPVAQQSAIAFDPLANDGSTVEDLRSIINSMLTVMRNYGLIAS
jgi:hypothetical protein